MKDLADFGSRDPRLQIGKIQSSSERVTQQLTQQSHGLLPRRFGFDGGAKEFEMLHTGTARRVDQARNRSNKLIIVAKLIQNTRSQRFDSVSRRVEQLRAEVAQGVFDNADKELVVCCSFSRLLQLTPAGLMNKS